VFICGREATPMPMAAIAFLEAVGTFLALLMVLAVLADFLERREPSRLA